MPACAAGGQRARQAGRHREVVIPVQEQEEMQKLRVRPAQVRRPIETVNGECSIHSSLTEDRFQDRT